MELPEANFDTTYCQSVLCKTKCWRHMTNWKFDKDKNYWFMLECEFKDKLDFKINEATL